MSKGWGWGWGWGWGVVSPPAGEISPVKYLHPQRRLTEPSARLRPLHRVSIVTLVTLHPPQVPRGGQRGGRQLVGPRRGLRLPLPQDDHQLVPRTRTLTLTLTPTPTLMNPNPN